MPHLIIEYTANIKNEAAIPELLEKANKTLLLHRDIIPIGGLRSRAIELKDYLTADGSADDAFVHATLKLGKGRSVHVKEQLCEDLFHTMKAHFATLYKQRYLALSLELHEFQAPTYKYNNIHERFKKTR